MLSVELRKEMKKFIENHFIDMYFLNCYFFCFWDFKLIYSFLKQSWQASRSARAITFFLVGSNAVRFELWYHSDKHTQS